MKTLITLCIVLLPTLAAIHAIAAELATPLTLSLLSRTNDANGKPVAYFRIANVANQPYYYYFQTQVPTPTGWQFARTQSRGAASAHTLSADQTNTIQVTPPRGANRWRLHLRYKPHGPKAQDASIRSQEILENSPDDQNRRRNSGAHVTPTFLPQVDSRMKIRQSSLL